MNLKTLLAGAILALTTACAPIYQVNIDNQHRCERVNEEDLKLFKDNKLLVKKISKLDDVFEFYDEEKKIGRLNLLPDGSFNWYPVNSPKYSFPREALIKMKKCNESLESQYQTNFLATEE
ncbi:MAG: hypothetical protein KKF52_00250 [Nanoarchaeota archaeon]|nr:hypothetical protein [Nanoarchaeota archaeon]MBU4241641.1 hypothetical protein [Nanoarchaeota archaeon]MBU4351931.1 hypothetical protein [Nanoarchaeota archaeon]